MSSAEESPAQRSARLRRERREAKIRDGGAARLDKITSMSGRTPASAQEDTSPSRQPPSVTDAAPQTRPAPVRPEGNVETQSPESIQAQQEYIGALLRQSGPTQPPQGQEEDPTMKLLSSLLGGMPQGEQNAGAPPAAGNGRGEESLGLSPADIAASLGVPPFISNMLRSKPQTEVEKKQLRTWKVLHVAFSIAVAVYLLFVIGNSITMYGSQPPPPATAQNPFVIFMTGELVLSGARLLLGGREGGMADLGVWVQMVREIIQDGSVVLFLLGMGTWWHRGWLA